MVQLVVACNLFLADLQPNVQTLAYPGALDGPTLAPVGDARGDTAALWPEGEGSALPVGARLEDRFAMRRHARQDGVLPLVQPLREWPVAAPHGAAPATADADRPAPAADDR